MTMMLCYWNNKKPQPLTRAMPDTTYYFNGTDTVSLEPPPAVASDSLALVMEREIQKANMIEARKERERIARNESFAFATFALVVLGFGIYKIIKSKDKGYIITNRGMLGDYGEYDRDYYVPAEPEPTETYTRKRLVYDGSELGLSRQEIITILQKHYPYYNNLNPIQRGKFVDRLEKFMADKTFIIHSHEGFKEMPVLLSAAAVQLTFGLEKFMLPHFRFLQVHPEEYFADGSFRVLAGNVYDNSITLAWNQFLKGFKNPADGINVGLHEMAHAVYYQHVVIDKKREMDFCNCFNEVMEEGAEVYELKKEHQVLFTNYAFKDLQEFWAESVELFFERPFDLKAHYPELFEAIKDLLNQDPCNSSNPVMTM
jgi:Mlc titration factor MtfA (ptsG expression regulator)